MPCTRTGRSACAPSAGREAGSGPRGGRGPGNGSCGTPCRPRRHARQRPAGRLRNARTQKGGRAKPAGAGCVLPPPPTCRGVIPRRAASRGQAGLPGGQGGCAAAQPQCARCAAALPRRARGRIGGGASGDGATSRPPAAARGACARPQCRAGPRRRGPRHNSCSVDIRPPARVSTKRRPCHHRGAPLQRRTTAMRKGRAICAQAAMIHAASRQRNYCDRASDSCAADPAGIAHSLLKSRGSETPVAGFSPSQDVAENGFFGLVCRVVGDGDHVLSRHVFAVVFLIAGACLGHGGAEPGPLIKAPGAGGGLCVHARERLRALFAPPQGARDEPSYGQARITPPAGRRPKVWARPGCGCRVPLPGRRRQSL